MGEGISSQTVVLERIHWALDELKQKNPVHSANPKAATYMEVLYIIVLLKQI
ncbi:hypothetical protein [Neobacillus sp. Marseille-QA0830]